MLDDDDDIDNDDDHDIGDDDGDDIGDDHDVRGVWTTLLI
jgi:hypothetical protein